ncbi:uncharacterized protein FFB20_06555 [Fusarium fujikuroi]|nr:uncharacterized protein FFB20_06555 [Fusarium fujikuroi]SCO11203.1 uncharacterized protein FFC1_11423 [Fusarium fujikuroi]SCO13731.1 uncharacterized protein FFE2_12933 [Fusarium fujikuroi]SCO18472.1 uncharacterized protein FFM5_11856 [Fusarium fujikuroi]SCO40744.1 uncharacterized protein FFNC_07654 [Fusarium fujikuroi]
MSQYSRGGDE